MTAPHEMTGEGEAELKAVLQNIPMPTADARQGEVEAGRGKPRRTPRHKSLAEAIHREDHIAKQMYQRKNMKAA